MGDLDLYLIYQTGEHWEAEWKPLQGDPITELLTVVSLETMTHALKGLSRPLIQSLGIPPEGALRKLPNKKCYQRGPCPFYDKKRCQPTAKSMPWCFEPDDIEDVPARKLASSLIKMWREGVYVVVVQQEEDNV
jgi:hypothetical protein